MNRRGFLKLLGIGLPAALIAPKIFAEPNNEIARATEISEPWYAPAGFNRGTLDEVNQRRLLVEIKKAMEESLEHHLYEPNDQITRSSIQSMMSARLEYMRQHRAIVDYVAVCNDANNPPYRVDRGFVNLDVSVQPVRSVSHINLVATLSKRNVSFTEFNNEIARRFE